MSSTAPRLLVVDQSLADFAGHHHAYGETVLCAAARLGLDVMLAAHRSFAADSLAGAPVVARFASAWSESRLGPFGRSAKRTLATMPGMLRRPLLGAVDALWRHRDVVTGRSDFGDCLAGIIDAQRLGAADHVFIHTLDAGEILALAVALAGRHECPLLHLMLRYDIADDRRARRDLAAALQLLETAPRLARRCRFYSDTEPLAALYGDLGVPGVTVLPIPHGLPARRAEPADGPLVLAYLGGARGDKGYDRLPGLVEAVADDVLRRGRARFVIQSHYTTSREEPAMAQARRRLAAWPADCVELIDQPLDTAAFQALLFATAIVVLPYRAEAYRRRSAGLLVQAAAAGIPTVVPADSWLAEAAPPGAFVAFGGDVSLANAIRRAIIGYPSLRTAAAAAADSFRQRHDSDRLVDILIAQSSSAPRGSTQRQ